MCELTVGIPPSWMSQAERNGPARPQQRQWSAQAPPEGELSALLRLNGASPEGYGINGTDTDSSLASSPGFFVAAFD